MTANELIVIAAKKGTLNTIACLGNNAIMLQVVKADFIWTIKEEFKENMDKETGIKIQNGLICSDI